MKKKILMITHFSDLPNENSNGRFTYLKKLLENDFEVKFITSSFSHDLKKQRFKENNLDCELIKESGYKKNVSLKRIYSHYIFGKNLKSYLENYKSEIDLIYCSVPSLNSAKVCINYAKQNNIKIIIDIQDLWPEAFKMIFNPPFLGKIIYYLFQKQADFIYKNADEIVAVSETYVQRALKVNSKVKQGYGIFLGNDLEEYDRLKGNSHIIKEQNLFWITYVGTLGHSYDIKIIIDALKIIQEKYKINNIEFLILGDGPLKIKFEAYAKRSNIRVKFLGRVTFKEVVNYLEKSDIVVNPIIKGAAQSIINKVGDYAAAGKAVINTQECLEYKELIDYYKSGFNCKNSDAEEIANRILELYFNSELREEMGKNNRRLAEEKFNRKKTYKQIVELIKKIKL